MSAGFRTDAAMLHSHGGMLRAFLRTGITDIRTKLAIAFRKFSIERHHNHRSLTRQRTFLIQPDTVPQQVHMVFFQTGIFTLPAYSGTIGTRIDTFPVFTIRHKKSFKFTKTKKIMPGSGPGFCCVVSKHPNQ